MRRLILLIGACLLLGIGPDSYAQGTGRSVLMGSTQTAAVPRVPEAVDRGMQADAFRSQRRHLLNPSRTLKVEVKVELGGKVEAGEFQIIPLRVAPKNVDSPESVEQTKPKPCCRKAVWRPCRGSMKCRFRRRCCFVR